MGTNILRGRVPEMRNAEKKGNYVSCSFRRSSYITSSNMVVQAKQTGQAKKKQKTKKKQANSHLITHLLSAHQPPCLLLGTVGPYKTEKCSVSASRFGFLGQLLIFPSMGSNSQRWNEAARPSRHNQIGSCMEARRV